LNVGKVIAGFAAAVVAAEGVYAAAAGPSTLLRPPGSQSEADFMSRCIKCGKCIEACPYKAIHTAGPLAGAAAGTPCIDAENQACRMCEDFPCVAVCPTGALRDVATREDVDMGYAKLNENTCIAFQGMRCEVCYRVCPLIDRAIEIKPDALQGDDIHARLIPTVNKDICTGCGLCVQRCVVREPEVPIRIVSIAEQEKKGIRDEA
jgi:ferredoxin-type protein NapG